MAGISASQVKELRDRTGAGMMDCKNALAESGGDVEVAVDWLRKKGLAAAAKRSGRTASQGLVALAQNGQVGAVVEVNSETDFVARNEKFQDFVTTVADVALGLPAGSDADALKQATYPGTSHTVQDQLTQLIGTIGENMSLRRAATVDAGAGMLGTYLHGTIAPGLGKIGVLVRLDTSNPGDGLGTLGRQLAMHVAAANPQSISREDLDAAVLRRERDVLMEQARGSGKPENIIEKMVEGRLRKFFEEVCLVDQVFVIDSESKVGKVLENASKEAGGPVTVGQFVRFALGEGLGKQEEDQGAA